MIESTRMEEEYVMARYEELFHILLCLIAAVAAVINNAS